MFRSAVSSDREILFDWRRDSELEGIVGGWYEGKLTTISEHGEWWCRGGKERTRIWVENESRCGMVRVDSNGELSFYVPKRLRGTNVAHRMLEATHSLASEFGGRLKATVDEGNTWAWQALKEAGFREYPVRFLAYKP